MLIISALLSIVLVTFIYFSHKKEDGSPVLLSFFLAGGSIVLGTICLLPTLMLHGLLVFFGALAWKLGGWNSTSFLAYLCLAAVGPYGYFAYAAFEHVADHKRLLAQYAFESMEDRVPAPKIVRRAKAPNHMESHLAKLEATLKDQGENDLRSLMLQRLHEDSVRIFIDSPGFGQGRRIRPTELSLKVNLQRDESPVSQPGTPPLSTISESDLNTEPQVVQPESLREMHFASVLDFVNPLGFGWVVNRQKAAGFRPHHFSMVPKANQWKVQAVELVGILLHEQPIIYMSDELPSMEKLRRLPTRSLNSFESAGLQKLQEGNEMFVRETSEGVRMLGAIRSVEQCMKCHGGERGDLLGAFSYSLIRSASDPGR